jgi:hypothetical protein
MNVNQFGPPNGSGKGEWLYAVLAAVCVVALIVVWIVIAWWRS